MDLALARSCSLAELESTTTERELVLWEMYDAQRILPHRRMELHLAQITLQTAIARGVKNVKLEDFLFVARRADARKAFAFSPRKKKRG